MSRARAQSFVSDSAAAAENEPTENLQRCLVYCRMRPTKPGELNEKDGTFKLVELNKKRIIVGQNGEKEYAYDGTFGGDSTQEDIFQEVAKPSLMHVLKGYTAAIMCYGQTGTGKSFTMSNTRLGQEGIIPRSAGFLFDLIEQTKTKEYTLTAHFVQIYRDHLSDLMKENQAEAKVDIRFDTKKGVEIMNCTNIPVPSKAAFLEMYKEGDARRIVRPTKMNPESSRGHTALVLYVKSRSTDPDDMSMPTEGKITFIDLAGYERFDKTGVKDPIHKDEAKKINASLLSLGHVVTALSQGEKFVPWRNSKLTRLLQDSIGGRSRSTIVITIGPSSASLHETTNSLEFGNRAMDVAVSSNKEENVDFQKLAAKLQLLLDESEEHVNKLVLAEKTREAERLDRERRHKHDIDRLRGRHRDELTRLMEEGATRERIEELLRLQEVEDLNLQEQQIEERDMDDSRFEEEERTMVQGIEQEHMVRAASMRKEATAAKQRELDTACEMIAKLRNTEPTPEALLAIAAEISEQAGSPSPSDPEEAASPRTVNSAELAILVRQIEELKREAEEKEEKTRETTEKMKAAHLKCANLLKEQREKNKAMVEETVAREDLERLQGQLDEMTTARDSAASHRDELEDKMQTMQKQVNHSASECEKMALESKKAQSMIAQLTAFKEELEEKLQVARQEREEVVEEYNRKEREKEASREETAADSTRKITELNGEIGELKATIGTVEATLAEVKAEKKSLDEQLAALTANLEEQKKLLAERDEKEKQLNAAIESEKERSEGASATGKKRERELETAVEQCRDETRAIEKQLKSEIEDTETRCAQRVASLAEEIRDLEQKLEQGTTELAAATARADELATQVEDGKGREAALQGQVEAEQAKLADAEGQRGEVGEEVARVKGELEACRAELEEAQKGLQDAEASHEDTKALLEANEEELNEEKKRFEDLEDAKDALQRELEDAKADSEEERERITSEHAEELAKERERIEQLEDEAECSTELQNVLEERVKELEEELQRLQGDLKDLKTTSELETEETRRRSNLEREQERLRQEMEQAVMREQIKNARKNAVGGKYKYSSKLVSQLIGAGQMPIPRSAPPLLKREEILETLDLEEVRSALRYNIVCVGAQHTGKSSIQKLLSHTSGGGLMKKAPDVVTPSPGFSRAEYISKDKGSSKGFSLGKKNTVNTYFNVWDTPCDPRMLQGLPAGALPAAGCCYTVSFFLNHEFVSEAKKMEEVLLGVFSCIGAKAKGKRVPVMLVGTRKDLLHNSKDGMLAIKKIAEAKKWFRENAILKERFKLIDCFAVSVKDWSVQNDSGKTGVSSFGQIMSMLANELQAVYPITPPALLGRDTTPAHQADIADWHHSLDGRDVSGDKAREEKAIYESVLSIIVLLHRMRQRKTWLVGQADFNSVVTDNIPSFALEPNPAVVDHIQDFLSCRGDAFSRRDLEYKDPREGVVVLDPLMLCNFVDTLMLPSLYLSLVDVYADKPGHLKQVIQKSTGFNVEEFWRPDWELIFDGKVSGTATSCLLKGFTPFKKDPVLGRRFLGLLGVCFQHDKLKTDQVDFMPSMAICTMSPEIQSLFLSLFKKTKGDWSPCSARIEQGVSAHVASEVLRQVYQMDPNAILWRDGAAFSDNGAWAYVKLEPARISICCEGKGSPLQKVLQKAVEASLDSSAALTWKDGLHMDELPRLPPALSKEVDDAESIGALLAKLPRDRLRGVSYPAGTIDLDMRRRH
eukprot:TRINITY_DN5019_c0_g1_i13.p1 TRINITY_DN5019_c0_g1~~TRINITY_DN5019_c0_g1_i13.p1  ORF type:complete len:1737 (+),score=885.94 TRINITY_DN5019_c0_g1_i13:117-5327(+)